MKRTCLLLILLATTLAADAQIRNNNRNNVRNRRAPSLSTGLQVMDPLGEFSTVSSASVGLSGAFLINNGRSPLEWGAQVSWHPGSRTKRSATLEYLDDEGNTVYEEAEIKMKNNLNAYHLVSRLKPFAGAFQPYVDGMAGVKVITLKEELSNVYDGFEEPISTERLHRDIASSYGWAAGAKIRLNRSVMLELRFENMRGGRIDFVDPDSVVQLEDGSFTYDLIDTRTSSYNYHVGLSFEF